MLRNIVCLYKLINLLAKIWSNIILIYILSISDDHLHSFPNLFSGVYDRLI